MNSPPAGRAKLASRARMSEMIGVSAVPVFLKYSVHSTLGKSPYSTARQVATRPVAGSVKAATRSVLAPSILRDERSTFHVPRSPADGLPS